MTVGASMKAGMGKAIVATKLYNKRFQLQIIVYDVRYIVNTQHNLKQQGVKAMAKGQDSKKSVKKASAKTPKEKKAEKQEKKAAKK